MSPAMLDRVVLDPDREAALDRLAAGASGPAPWRARKRAEVRDLLALEQVAPRLMIDSLDLRTHLDALVRLKVPVPCRPELTVLPMAVLAIRYVEEAVRTPQPGYSFVQIVAPRPVFHANVSDGADGVQALCLGPTLPAGIPLREIVLASYAALAMQSVQVDERDPAGVMNAAAARWWQRNLHRIPLSNVPFLGLEDLS